MKVTLLMAITLDGKIGKNADHFPDWTGRADKQLFVEMTRRAGVMIMGSRTYDTIGVPLPGRKSVVMTRNPRRVSDRDDLLFTAGFPAAILAGLEAEGFAEAILAGGASVNTLFARENLIDEIVVTVSPLIFGQGLSLFADGIDLSMELLDVERIDDNRVCLRYKVIS